MSIIENQIQNDINLAKSKLAIDINAGLANEVALTKFIDSMKAAGVTDTDTIIKDCFFVIYSVCKESNIFDELMKIYPDNAEDISKYFIIFLKKNGSGEQEILASIKEFYTKYGEDKEMLFIELDYLIANGFKDIERITYIMNKCNTDSKTV